MSGAEYILRKHCHDLISSYSRKLPIPSCHCRNDLMVHMYFNKQVTTEYICTQLVNQLCTLQIVSIPVSPHGYGPLYGVAKVIGCRQDIPIPRHSLLSLIVRALRSIYYYLTILFIIFTILHTPTLRQSTPCKSTQNEPCSKPQSVRNSLLCYIQSRVRHKKYIVTLGVRLV